MDAELSACNECGVAVFDPAKHREHCPASLGDAERNGQVIDAFLASIDCHAIDRAILDGTVDEPFNTATVIAHLRGQLRA